MLLSKAPLLFPFVPAVAAAAAAVAAAPAAAVAAAAAAMTAAGEPVQERRRQPLLPLLGDVPLKGGRIV